MFVRARELGKPVDEYALSGFLDEATNLAHRIEEWRSGYLWQLRYLQMLLIVLAIGSLFAIMLLLWRWVIRPINELGEGINRLSGGDLTARVTPRSEDEIGRIAQGFNRMADRLEDLYNNLEQKVAEKDGFCRGKESSFGAAL